MMRWRVFRLPQGITRNATFPGAIPESFTVDRLINAALLSVKEYISIHGLKDHTHFVENPMDSCISELVEDVTRVVFNVYDAHSSFPEILTRVEQSIGDSYDRLKDNFFYSAMHQGVYGGIDQIAQFNTYIAWLDENNFILVEYPERMSLDGITQEFPWLNDYYLLG